MQVGRIEVKPKIDVLRWMYIFYALGWLVILLIFAFPFALLFVFWSESTGGNLFYGLCRYYARLWLKVTGMRYQEIHRSTGCDHQEKPCVYVANHRSYIDVFLMLASMHRPYRPLGKAQMAAIPLFGFFYKRFVITVDRRMGISRSKSFIDLKRVLERSNSVFIFPEGTFNESEAPLKSFYNGPFQLALRKNVNIQPVVFLDSLDRMHYSSVFTMRPGVCRVLYLEEIDVKEYFAGKPDALRQHVYDRMHAALIEYKDYDQKSG